LSVGEFGLDLELGVPLMEGRQLPARALHVGDPCQGEEELGVLSGTQNRLLQDRFGSLHTGIQS
jgi:hypothetical protein